MTHDGLVLQPLYSRRLLLTSCLAPLSAALALSLRLPGMAVVPAAVFVTSVNYWRRPTRGMRRRVDCAVTLAGFWYQCNRARALRLPHAIPYCVLTSVAGLCYRAARRSDKQEEASFCHAGLHVFANAANVALYVALAKTQILAPL